MVLMYSLSNGSEAYVGKEMLMEPEPRGIVFPRPWHVCIDRIDIPRIEGNTVLVKSDHSLISNGTERIIFERSFSAGSHWDRWVRYPFSPGYATVGKIIAIGSNVTDYKIGDRVAVRSPHASHSCVLDRKCMPIPDEVAPEDAVWFALAKIAFWGVLVASQKNTEIILVVGGGPVAQMVIRWAATFAAGPIAILARDHKHLTVGLSGGATVALLGRTNEYSAERLQRALGKRPQIIVDCTANVDVLPWSLSVIATYGRVVLVGDPGSPNDRRLTSDVLLRGLSIVGVHDRNSYPDWDSKSVSNLFFSKLSSKAVRVEEICTHNIPPELAQDAYGLVSRRETGVLGMRFDW